MRHDNDNRRRRERAVTIYGAIWAAVLALVVGCHFLPAGPVVLTSFAR